MPALTRIQSTHRPKELYQPLFFEASTQMRPFLRQKKSKRNQETFDEDQIEASQPLLADPTNMYLQGHHNQEMTHQTLKNEPIMRFPSNTSPTHGMVQWIPKFEPIFIPIPPRGGSVTTTPKD